MSPLPTVLIFTYAEYGQANVNLATAYELALAGTNVYIASFPQLSARVSRLQELVVRHASRASSNTLGSVSFRACKGTPRGEAVRKSIVKKDVNFTHSHGVWGALKSYSTLGTGSFPWSQEDYLAGIEDCKEIITAIKPNVVVVDIFFNFAQDACKLADQRFMLMSPNSIKEIAVSVQPYLAAFWKYPAVSSGFPFPLKLWQIPLNIYLNIRHYMQTRGSVKIKQMGALRRSLGIRFVPDGRPDRPTLCPALAEIDFPFAIIPKEILLCGPIVMPFDPLEESDPALMKWLDNGPTIMVNLGSHVVSDEGVAREMAGAFRLLLDYHDQRGTSKIQILWKAKANGDIQTVIDEIIGKEIKEGRVKVLPWLEVEPVAVLQHPNVVCTVHHGGGNSFYEGIWAGIPHIALPVWYFTYEFASRIEFLNIGIFGNKTCAPSVRAEEFGKALVRVTGDTEEADKFKRSAQYMKELCRMKGNGRELSSAAILKEAGVKNARTRDVTTQG